MFICKDCCFLGTFDMFDLDPVLANIPIDSKAKLICPECKSRSIIHIDETATFHNIDELRKAVKEKPKLFCCIKKVTLDIDPDLTKFSIETEFKSYKLTFLFELTFHCTYSIDVRFEKVIR